MLIEGRKKGFAVMQSFWIMAIAAVYAYATEEIGTFLLVLMFMTGILQLIGSFVYLGYTGILAGFNTMTQSEMKKYDMEKVSSFLGISSVSIAFVLFLISFFILTTVGGEEAFAVLFVLFISFVLLLAVYPSAKRFRR
jgi:hypothetical protein